MFPADPKERTEIIQKHLDAVRYHPDLMYDSPVEIEEYEPNRLEEAFKVQLTVGLAMSNMSNMLMFCVLVILIWNSFSCQH